MKNSKRGMLALIILLAVGFAAVTATLVINGTSIFGANNDDFDVIFTKAIIDGVENNTVISDDGKSITYATKELAIKDEESILDFTVKNNSTQYDAEVSIECIGGGSVGTYYEIEKNVAAYIPAQTEDVGKVIVRMIKSSTEPIEEEFTCTITAVAVERETGADIVPSCTPITTCNEAGDVCWIDSDCSGNKNIGDVVALGTDENSIEQFYILDSDENNTQMISMYNLYVGGEYTSSWTAYTNPTGIQDSTMIGYDVADTSVRRGTTVFSSVEVKGTNYSDYEGSIVEGYVNNYSTYLINTLGIENTATLISKEELEEIVGQTLSAGTYLNNIGTPAFLYSTTYWTRSATDTDIVWIVGSDSGFDNNYYNDDNSNGVRPVVTIDNEVFTREIPSEPEEEITYEDTDSSGTRNIGDIITISKEGASSEQFYILSDDGTNIQMMSMYNLYVGAEYDGLTWTAYENPTGIQDSTMLGYTSAETLYKGVTAFSSVEQKGENNSDYTGSIVEGYVNDYSTYLSNTLGIENTATLISKEELETIVGQTLVSGNNLSTLGAPAFLYSTSYWTRSADSTSNVWDVYSGGYFGSNSYSLDSVLGVRPVITVSSSLV